MVLEKTLKSPMDCKEIKPISSPIGNQPRIFITRTDAEAEAPILGQQETERGPGADAPWAEIQPPQDGVKALPIGSCTRLSSSLDNIKPAFQNPSRVP